LTGDFFYNSKMLWYQDEFYYLARTDYNLLMKYDFNNNQQVIVDSLSEVTGATIEHALESVNGELVVSLREGFIQHELYVLGLDPTSIKSLSINHLDVRPTLADQYITLILAEGLDITSGADLFIYNGNGQVASVPKIDDKSINVGDLPSGIYIGILKSEDKIYQFRFVRQ